MVRVFTKPVCVSPPRPCSTKSRFTALASNPQPEIFARPVNALSRLTRVAIAAQKYRDAFSGSNTGPLRHKGVKSKLNDEETRAVCDHVDRVLGFKYK